MKRLILLVVVLVLGFYVAWPAFSGYQINNALQANDAAALARKIDFPSVRASMRDPILGKIEQRLGAVMKQLGPAAALIGGNIKMEKFSGIIDASLEDVVNAKRVGDIYAKGGDFAGALTDSILAQIDKIGGFEALLGIGQGSGDAAGGTSAGGGGTSIGGIKLPGGLGALLGSKEARGIVGQLAGKSGFDAKKLKTLLFPKKPKAAASGNGGDGEPSSFGLSNIKKFGFAGPLGLQLGVARDSSSDAPDVTAQMEFSGFDWKVTKLIPDVSRF